MKKHLIFLIHGIGDSKPGWSSSIQKKLKELYAQYTVLNSKYPFEDRFKFVEINYNDIFEDIRKRWKEDTDAIHAQMESVKGQGISKDVVTYINGLGGKDDFISTHILDLIFYRLHAMTRDRVKVMVAKQIIDTLLVSNYFDWSILAHSMGTAVIHDTLHSIYTTKITDNDFLLTPGNTRPNLIMMVSNTSKLLETDVKAYESIVKPTKDKSGACKYYFNIGHKFDVVATTDPFSPTEDWLDAATSGLIPKRYEAATNLDHVVPSYIRRSVLNLHEVEHYMENPKVHIPCFRMLTNDEEIITPAEETDSINKFQAQTNTDITSQLKQKIEESLLASDSDLLKKIQNIAQFYWALQEVYKNANA